MHPRRGSQLPVPPGQTPRAATGRPLAMRRRWLLPAAGAGHDSHLPAGRDRSVRWLLLPAACLAHLALLPRVGSGGRAGPLLPAARTHVGHLPGGPGRRSHSWSLPTARTAHGAHLLELRLRCVADAHSQLLARLISVTSSLGTVGGGWVAATPSCWHGSRRSPPPVWSVERVPFTPSCSRGSRSAPPLSAAPSAGRQDRAVRPGSLPAAGAHGVLLSPLRSVPPFGAATPSCWRGSRSVPPRSAGSVGLRGSLPATRAGHAGSPPSNGCGQGRRRLLPAAGAGHAIHLPQAGAGIRRATTPSYSRESRAVTSSAAQECARAAFTPSCWRGPSIHLPGSHGG